MLYTKNNSGITLIAALTVGVIVLGVAGAATVVVTNTLRGIRDQEQSVKALAAAEAGAEMVLGADNIGDLIGDCPISTGTQDNENYIPTKDDPNVEENCKTTVVDEGVSYYIEVGSKGGGNTYSVDIQAQDSVLEVSTEGLGGNLEIEWGSSEDGVNNYASLLVTEVYQDGDYKVNKYAINPSAADQSPAQAEAGFTTNSTIELSSGSKILRIKPLFFDARDVSLTLDSGTFPSEGQGLNIYATGCACDDILSVDSRRNASVRKIKVEKSREHLPAIFDYVLYSGSEDVPLSK